MKVIGIDVGLRHTGYAVLEDGKLLSYGVYSTTNNSSLPERLKELYEAMKLLFQRETPNVAVYETIFYKQNPKTLCTLAQVRGVLLLVAEELGTKIKEYTPAEIKQAITGNGRASKYQIHGMVEQLLGIKLLPSSDISDAVACALCYSLRNEK